MGATENKQRTIRTIEILNSGDAEGYVANYAEDAVVHGLPHGFEPTRDGLRGFIGAMLTALPDLQLLIGDAIAENDRVAIRGRFGATHRGELLGAAPTGNHLEWETTAILRFGPDGRIVERWVQDDILALLVQLGLVQHSVVVPA